MKPSSIILASLALACLVPAFTLDLQAQDSRSRRSSTTDIQRAQSQVTVVADERSNSIIVSASTNMHASIQQLIGSIDSNVDDITEIRVFPLENADPVELSEILTQLFDENASDNENNPGFRPSFMFGGFSRSSSRSRGNDDDALRSNMKVVAVPDQRTSSLIVSAPRQMMEQISGMVKQLDSSSARKQKVFVYHVDHADVNNVSEILRGMFESQNSRNINSQNNQNQNNALRTRSGTFGQAGANTGIGATSGAQGGGLTGR